eukprot:4086373-Prymnesium_polylepis.1
MARVAADRALAPRQCPRRPTEPTERRGRPCALRVRQGDRDRGFEQAGGRSHSPEPRERTEPESAPFGRLGKLSAV